jgi:uncharacterized membrane protein YwzB
MTGLLIFIIVVVLILALAIWAIRLIPFIDEPVKSIVMVLAILIAIVVIAQRAGVF